jgi:hypothetical protein
MNRRLRGLDDNGLVNRRNGVPHPWVKFRICEPRHRLLVHGTKHEGLGKGSEDRLLLCLEGNYWLRYTTSVDDGPSEAIVRSNV